MIRPNPGRGLLARYLAFESRLDARLRAGGTAARRTWAGERAWPSRLTQAALHLARRGRTRAGSAGNWPRQVAGLATRLLATRPRGGLRFASELAGDTATALAFGLVAALCLAQPAFRDTRGDWLKRLQLSVTFLDRDGREIGHRGIHHDDTATLADMPSRLIEAVIATEDRRFRHHVGIDPIGLVRAVLANARAGVIVQGGSTISQQLAKILFLTNERSLQRKIREAFLAFWLEGHFSKDQILALYLDRAYLGAGTFGVAAAAQHYFDKPVRALNLPEAAMLAGLLKAPTRYAPHADSAAAQARASEVVGHMVEAGYITREQAETARAHPALSRAREPAGQPDYYLDWAFREVEALAVAGRLGPDNVLSVRTPLDRSLQNAAETAIARALARDGARYGVRQAALVTLTPEGGLRAMVGGRDYGASGFNRAADARRQPGSAFKPFVYAAALLDGGYSPDSVVDDAPICLAGWCPQNYGRTHAGPVPLWFALAKSINTVPVRLAIGIGQHVADAGTRARRVAVGGLASLGRARIVALARRMGLRTPLPDSAALPLGAAEVTVLDMAAGYAVLAEGGRATLPYAAETITNSRGVVLYTHARQETGGTRALPAAVVAAMNGMLARVPEQGTGRRAALAGRRSAGKTGTTNDYRDAWYVGYTGDLVTAVWFGNDDHSATRGMTGGSLPAIVWHDVMEAGTRGRDPRSIPGLDAAEPGHAGFAAPAFRGPTRARGGFQIVTGLRRPGPAF